MNYIENTLIADAKAAIDKSKYQDLVDHKLLRGCLREDILLSVMTPWLPYFLGAGKGTIFHTPDDSILSGEDDILLYDKTICPPVKMYSESTNGIFHYNGVLARIEVKSSLGVSDLKQFIERSQKIMNFKVDVRKPGLNFKGAYNLLFGYDSRALKKSEIKRLNEASKSCGFDPLSGGITAMCILGKGVFRLWEIDGERFWQIASADDTVEKQLARFTAMITELCLQSHIERSGRSPEDSLEISVTNHIWDPVWDITT